MLDAFHDSDRAREATIVLTLVFPLVPVTPTNFTRDSGCPVTVALAWARSAFNWEDGTTTTGTGTLMARSATTQFAPRATASLAKVEP
jgi:hypothetical protein